MIKPQNAVSPLLLGLIPLAKAAIVWGPCGAFQQPTNLTFSCATLDVPLDYTNESSTEKLSLDLVKYDALVKPAKNSILLNFGGPGGEGVGLGLVPLAQLMQTVTGGASDLIGFNPRGTNRTIPFSCFKDATARAAAQQLYPDVLWNASSTASGEEWARSSLLASACKEQAADIGDLVGTQFVARDMMEIVDALDQGPLLNHYGMSYGSVLGETVAAMFPDRMGRVAIDGILNPYEYYHGYGISQYISTDDVFTGLLSSCLEAGPKQCALAQKNMTLPELEAEVEAIFENLKYNPIPIPELGLILEYSTVKAQISNMLDFPSEWPTVAAVLAGLAKSDVTPIIALFKAAAGRAPSIDFEALYGIRCGDGDVRASSLEDYEPITEEFEKTSKWFGEAGPTTSSRCAQWPFAAKERYGKDFPTCVKTRNPMLIVGNTYDPATSLESARNVTGVFEDSVLLQHNGYGHLSWAQRSTCTIQHMNSFFINGTMPPVNTVCQPDHKPFSPELSVQ